MTTSNFLHFLTDYSHLQREMSSRHILTRHNLFMLVPRSTLSKLYFSTQQNGKANKKSYGQLNYDIWKQATERDRKCTITAIPSSKSKNIVSGQSYLARTYPESSSPRISAGAQGASSSSSLGGMIRVESPSSSTPYFGTDSPPPHEAPAHRIKVFHPTATSSHKLVISRFKDTPSTDANNASTTSDRRSALPTLGRVSSLEEQASRNNDGSYSSGPARYNLFHSNELFAGSAWRGSGGLGEAESDGEGVVAHVMPLGKMMAGRNRIAAVKHLMLHTYGDALPDEDDDNVSIPGKPVKQPSRRAIERQTQPQVPADAVAESSALLGGKYGWGAAQYLWEIRGERSLLTFANETVTATITAAISAGQRPLAATMGKDAAEAITHVLSAGVAAPDAAPAATLAAPRVAPVTTETPAAEASRQFSVGKRDGDYTYYGGKHNTVTLHHLTTIKPLARTM